MRFHSLATILLASSATLAATSSAGSIGRQASVLLNRRTSGQLSDIFDNDQSTDSSQNVEVAADVGILGHHRQLRPSLNPIGDGFLTASKGSRAQVTIPVATKSTANIPLEFSASDLDGCLVTDVNLSVDIFSESASYLNVYLEGPDGTSVRVFGDGTEYDSYDCFYQNNYEFYYLTNLVATFDDSGAPFSPNFPKTTTVRPFDCTGKTKPSLRKFNGKSVAGTWNVKVINQAFENNGGTINSVSLDITGDCQKLCTLPHKAAGCCNDACSSLVASEFRASCATKWTAACAAAACTDNNPAGRPICDMHACSSIFGSCDMFCPFSSQGNGSIFDLSESVSEAPSVSPTDSETCPLDESNCSRGQTLVCELSGGKDYHSACRAYEDVEGLVFGDPVPYKKGRVLIGCGCCEKLEIPNEKKKKFKCGKSCPKACS